MCVGEGGGATRGVALESFFLKDDTCIYNPGLERVHDTQHSIFCGYKIYSKVDSQELYWLNLKKNCLAYVLEN